MSKVNKGEVGSSVSRVFPLALPFQPSFSPFPTSADIKRQSNTGFPFGREKSPKTTSLVCGQTSVTLTGECPSRQKETDTNQLYTYSVHTTLPPHAIHSFHCLNAI